MNMQNLEEMMGARRAEVAPTEVIPPADRQTGEIMPAVEANGNGMVPVPEGQASPNSSSPLPAPEPATAFPLIPPKVLGGLPYASNYMKLAKTIHQTELVPKAFKGRPDAIMAAMMYGYELGLGPMQALNGLHVIEGKVGQDAELMRALITEQGHLFALNSGEDENGEPWATVTCRRKDWPDDFPTATFTWTLQSGREAGLVEWYEKWTKTERGGNRKLTWNPHGTEEQPGWVTGNGVEHKYASSWANYGEDMCIARATARAARANFSDVLKGMSYTPEELREFDGGNAGGQQEEAPPSPTPPDTPPPVSGPSALETTPPAPPVDASATPAPPAPASEPVKKAAAPKKARAKHAATPVDSDPSEPDSSPDAAAKEETTASTPTASPVQPDLAGSVPVQPEVEPFEPLEPGETTLMRELRASLAAVLNTSLKAQQPIIRAFLAQHFPGRTSADLDAEELTKAINIVGGWPESADQYPAPEPAAPFEQ